ncbi:hypothetical protein QCA50_005484 [Cerrena zonata]|uniref:F-box domain-containing protein n=1 Tax=Cerrena zonata TaxID=2478898 RepID=A0AAW0GF31_9APHY
MPSPESILSKFSSLAACSSPQGSTSPLNPQLNMFSPIATIPEELLERILTFSIQFTSCDISPPSPLTAIAPRVSPLLVCKLWLRVGTPVYFHSITLATPEQTTRLVSLLNEQPQLGSFVRELKVEGIFPQVLDVMRCLRAARSDQTISLRKLDLQLDGPTSMPDVESFCDALDCVANVQQFVVRKPSSVYLTQPGVMLAMKHISEGFEKVVGFNFC